MIPPLEEIRIARDTVEMIITLSTKHPGLQWAIEALEFKNGKWRVVTVVYRNGELMRFEDSWAAKTTPIRMCSRVNEILSQF